MSFNRFLVFCMTLQKWSIFIQSISIRLKKIFTSDLMLYSLWRCFTNFSSNSLAQKWTAYECFKSIPFFVSQNQNTSWRIPIKIVLSTASIESLFRLSWRCSYFYLLILVVFHMVFFNLKICFYWEFFFHLFDLAAREIIQLFFLSYFLCVSLLIKSISPNISLHCF